LIFARNLHRAETGLWTGLELLGSEIGLVLLDNCSDNKGIKRIGEMIGEQSCDWRKTHGIPMGYWGLSSYDWWCLMTGKVAPTGVVALMTENCLAIQLTHVNADENGAIIIGRRAGRIIDEESTPVKGKRGI